MMSKFFKRPRETSSSSEDDNKPIINEDESGSEWKDPSGEEVFKRKESLEAESGEENDEGEVSHDQLDLKYPGDAEDIHAPHSRFASDSVRIDPHGRGFYGQIFVCEHRIDRNKYAAKRITVEDGVKIPFEIFALSRMNNKNIVRFHQVWKEPYVHMDCTSSSEENSLVAANRTNKPYCYYILMEFCPRTLSELWDGKEEVDVKTQKCALRYEGSCTNL